MKRPRYSEELLVKILKPVIDRGDSKSEMSQRLGIFIKNLPHIGTIFCIISGEI